MVGAMLHRRADQGWIEVICGPMFSGKSEELIRRVTRYHLARVPTQTFKPSLDSRYSVGEVVSHSKLSTAAEPVPTSEDLLRAVEDRTVVVGVDEGQFFDDDLVDVASLLAGAGKRVIVAGLDTDYIVESGCAAECPGAAIEFANANTAIGWYRR